MVMLGGSSTGLPWRSRNAIVVDLQVTAYRAHDVLRKFIDKLVLVASGCTLDS